MEAIGAVDELNSALGMLAAKPLAAPVLELLRHVQNDLFDVGAELSYPGYKCLAQESLERLDAAIGELNGRLPSLKDFVLPGGSEAGALCHFIRALCRSTERRVVTWQDDKPAKDDLKIPYLNRLSDLLFVLARSINHDDGATETCWVSPAARAKNKEQEEDR